MAAARGLGKGLDIMLPDNIGTANAKEAGTNKKPVIGKDIIFVWSMFFFFFFQAEDGIRDA